MTAVSSQQSVVSSQQSVVSWQLSVVVGFKNGFSGRSTIHKFYVGGMTADY
ncbi:hypothetical protein QUA82_28710 [Microcoleus sp. F8-D3]